MLFSFIPFVQELFLEKLIGLYKALSCSELAQSIAFYGTSIIATRSEDGETLQIKLGDMDKALKFDKPSDTTQIHTLTGLENVIRIVAKDSEENMLRLGASYDDIMDAVHVLDLGNEEFKSFYKKYSRRRYAKRGKDLDLDKCPVIDLVIDFETVAVE